MRESDDEIARLVAREIDATLAACPPAKGGDVGELTRLALADCAQLPGWAIRAGFDRVRKTTKAPLRYAHIASGLEWARQNAAPQAPLPGAMSREAAAFADACLIVAWVRGMAVKAANHRNRLSGGFAALSEVAAAARTIVAEGGPGLSKARSWIDWARRIEAREPGIEAPIGPVAALIETMREGWRYGDHRGDKRAAARAAMAEAMGEEADDNARQEAAIS